MKEAVKLATPLSMHDLSSRDLIRSEKKATALEAIAVKPRRFIPTPTLNLFLNWVSRMGPVAPSFRLTHSARLRSRQQLALHAAEPSKRAEAQQEVERLREVSFDLTRQMALFVVKCLRRRQMPPTSNASPLNGCSRRSSRIWVAQLPPTSYFVKCKCEI